MARCVMRLAGAVMALQVAACAAPHTLVPGVMPASLGMPGHGQTVRGLAADALVAGPVIAEGRRVAAPAGFIAFCAETPSACATALPMAGAEPVAFDDAAAVNDAVNDAVRPMPDRANPANAGRGDRWAFPAPQGDCEDYALEKQRRLLARGADPRYVRLALVWSGATGEHAVLLVRTATGDVVLDSVTGAIRPWRDAGYRWIAVQSAATARTWHRPGQRTSGGA